MVGGGVGGFEIAMLPPSAPARPASRPRHDAQLGGVDGHPGDFDLDAVDAVQNARHSPDLEQPVDPLETLVGEHRPHVIPVTADHPAHDLVAGVPSAAGGNFGKQRCHRYTVGPPLTGESRPQVLLDSPVMGARMIPA